MKARRETILLLLLLSLTSILGGGGCAAAGLAAGPLVTAIQAIGGRAVERTFAADLQTTWTITVDTFARMDVQIRETERSGVPWVLEGVGRGVGLHAALVPVTPRMTKIALRVEAGGLFADKQTAEEILKQVGLSLERPPIVAQREPPAEPEGLATAVTTLQGEIRHLKSIIEDTAEKRAVSRPPAESERVAEQQLSRGSEILLIPSSYGVPVLTTPPNGSVPPAMPAARLDQHTPVLADVPPPTDPRGQEILAPSLVRVEPLTPVRSMVGGQRVR